MGELSREILLANTRIRSGNVGGSGTVITCTSGEGANTVINGFWITNGNADDGGEEHPALRLLQGRKSGRSVAVDAGGFTLFSGLPR